MILGAILHALLSTIDFILTYTLDLLAPLISLIPGVDFPVDSFPVIGGYDIDAFLETAFNYFAYVKGVIPPLDIMYDGFLVVLVFKLVMMVIRIFRILPAHHTGSQINS